MAVPNAQRGGRRDDGFTLIEMMVALIVLSVLVAIAVPTFLTARERTNNRSAQAKANTALKAHKASTANARPYVDVNDLVARLDDMEPSLSFGRLDETTVDPDADASVLGRVYVRLDEVDGDNVVTLVAASRSGKCYWTRDIEGETQYATTDCPAEPVASDFRSRWR